MASHHSKYGYLSPLTDKASESAFWYIKEWFSTTDAKRIGILYTVFAIIMGLIGAVLSIMIRAELMQAGPDLMGGDFYATLPGMHATMMIFFFIIPLFTGVGNFIVPIQVGAPDMAFPKLNLAGFWILPPAALMVISAYFLTAPWLRLDRLPAAVQLGLLAAARCGPVGPGCDSGRHELDDGRGELPGDGLQHALQEHDVLPDAAVYVVGRGHKLPHPCVDARC